MTATITTAFYDVLFGDTSTCSSMNEVEEMTLIHLRKTLNDTEQLCNHIPPLPKIVLNLIQSLKNPNADFLDFVAIIDQDPPLALSIMKIANTAKYSRGGEKIQSLKKAVNVLGAAGVASIATTILMQEIMPYNPIYFKMFGRQIWNHSLQCASLAQMLAAHYQQDEFDAHFLGLIHDVGKIIIFESMCNAFGDTTSNDAPGSKAFKELMTEMSLDMSYFIATEWQLPAEHCTALLEQRENKTSPLAKILFKANLLSEIYLLYSKGKIRQEKIIELLKKLKVDEEIWQNFIEQTASLEM